MTRVLSMMLAVCALASAPARAVPAGVVVTRGGSYYPADAERALQALTVPRGAELLHVNLDWWGHSVTSVQRRTDGKRLFGGVIVPYGSSMSVPRVPELDAGTYDFFCSNHPSMQGVLVVVDA